MPWLETVPAAPACGADAGAADEEAGGAKDDADDDDDDDGINDMKPAWLADVTATDGCCLACWCLCCCCCCCCCCC